MDCAALKKGQVACLTLWWLTAHELSPAERRLEGMYEALSAAGSNVVSLSRVAQALEGYEPSREPADSARQAAAAKLAEYRSATAPLDRFSFARCMTEFAQAMGVGLDEVVDYLSAIFLASGPELRGAKVSGRQPHHCTFGSLYAWQTCDDPFMRHNSHEQIFCDLPPPCKEVGNYELVLSKSF